MVMVFLFITGFIQTVLWSCWGQDIEEKTQGGNGLCETSHITNQTGANSGDKALVLVRVILGLENVQAV